MERENHVKFNSAGKHIMWLIIHNLNYLLLSCLALHSQFGNGIAGTRPLVVHGHAHTKDLPVERY